MNKNDKSRLTNKCQICNKKAVGFHYGAYVCEACKKFFVRHSTGTCKSYGFCQEKGDCNLNIDGRGKCQHCRYKRCIEIGMNIESKSSDYDLTSIPCQVCGAKSSGLHFGCITCEGCKGFFRRMIKLKGTLICFKENKCKLDMKNRSNCKSCRMKRCLEVGMSRKGIRIGRHTNSMKYNCLNMLKIDKVSVQTEDSTSDERASSKSDIISSESELPIIQIPTDQTKSVAMEPIDPMSTSSEDDSSRDEQNYSENEEPVVIDLSKPRQNNSEPLAKIPSNPEKSSYSELQIADDLACASKFLIHFKSYSDANFPDKNVLSTSDSIQSVWSVMMEHFVFHSQFIVKFAKLMPGFLRLSLTDKRTVIKHSMYPMILLELSQDYRETEIETIFNYFDFGVHDRGLILNYFPEFKKFCMHLTESGAIRFSLDLDVFEVTVLCGILMFYNYQNLENWMYGKSMILLYQEYLTLYFRSHLKLSDHDLNIRQKKCLDYVCVLNEMNFQHHEIIIDFCSKHQELEYPDLLIQICNH